MLETLVKNWWLLAVCGVLEASYSLVNFFAQDMEGRIALRQFAWKSTVVLCGRLALGAGACLIAAGLWRSAGGKWSLLALRGLAFFALGLIFNGVFGFRISFRTIALLMFVISI